MADGNGKFSAPFTPRQKAALLVQWLVANGQDVDLSAMSDESQLALSREIGTIETVDRIALDQVVGEFLDELDGLGLAGPGSISAALPTLSNHLSQTAATRLREEVSGKDPWPLIVDLPTEVFQRLMDRESVEVGSVVLSKLDVPLAAKLLGTLSGPKARAITYAMSLTEKVDPETVLDIGLALAQDYVQTTAKAFTDAPPQRLGSILTASRSNLRDAILEQLKEEDPVFSGKVRRAIFTFGDLPHRLAPPDVPTVIRNLDQKELITALAHALASQNDTTEAAVHLLSNLSQRMSDQLREDISDRGAVSPEDGEEAQSSIITTIRMMADTGEIALIRPKEATEPVK